MATCPPSGHTHRSTLRIRFQKEKGWVKQYTCFKDFWYRTFGFTSKILIVPCFNQSEKQRNSTRETHVPNSQILEGLVILPYLP